MHARIPCRVGWKTKAMPAAGGRCSWSGERTTTSTSTVGGVGRVSRTSLRRRREQRRDRSRRSRRRRSYGMTYDDCDRIPRRDHHHRDIAIPRSEVSVIKYIPIASVRHNNSLKENDASSPPFPGRALSPRRNDCTLPPAVAQHSEVGARWEV